MLDHPLRLAVGSHQAGSGKGCALNIVSWESGDTVITDLPDCADPMLARVVQRVNDAICTHRDGDLLCPECSLQVLALAHRLVGTGGPVDLGRRRVWVRIAADQARQALHLTGKQAAALAAIEAAEAWADDPSEENHIISARVGFGAYAYASAAYAYADAAAYAATAAASAAYAASNATYADTYASASASASSASGGGGGERLRLAHRAVDLFYELTGLTERTPDPARTRAAYAAMTTT